MYKNMKIAAVVPGRKGSKGIPNKNLKLLNGVPLIGHSIKQGLESKYIDKVIVSTDSEEIFNLAISMGINMKGLRPAEYSGDTAVLYDVMKYEIENHRLMEEQYDVIVLLQPTSPLRRSSMIDDALVQFIEEEQQSAVSVSLVNQHPLFMRTINADHRLERILNIESTVRRQELPPVYRVNGMIYINRTADIRNHYVSFNDNLFPIIIPNQYDVDIDTVEDFIEAEKRLNQDLLNE